MDSDMYSAHHHEEYNIPNILGLSEFTTLEPINQTPTVLSVSDTNNDQRVYESESPKSFVDLDNINGHGLSFYDDTALNIKTEKDMENVSYNCSMHNIESPYPMYTQHIKEEEEEDIGLSVIRHLKEEITNTCKILRISPGKRYFIHLTVHYLP